MGKPELNSSNGSCCNDRTILGSNRAHRLRTFSEFCVSVILPSRAPSTTKSVHDDNGRLVQLQLQLKASGTAVTIVAALENVASSYINGEAMESPIEDLFDLWIERFGDNLMDRGRSKLPLPAALKRFPYQRTDLEVFHKDLLGCLENTMLHDYVANSWDDIDNLVRINQKTKRSNGRTCQGFSTTETLVSNDNFQEDAEGGTDEGNLSTVANWKKSREAFFQKHKPLDLIERCSCATYRSRPNHFRCRRPTVYFLGGGMGAGKSTVVSYLKETRDEIFQHNPVIVEADAFKHSDPVFCAMTAVSKASLLRRHSGHQKALQSIHEHSTDAANLQLVNALANQRDVVVDGTMTWLPYVRQTIAMVRDAHNHRYTLGPGYSQEKEVYWERAGFLEPKRNSNNGASDDYEYDDAISEPLPYRVEMVGVTADPGHAVARGIRRAIVTGRGVPVDGQLRSHRLYSQHFPIYAGESSSSSSSSNEDVENGGECLFDRIRLYDTSVVSNSKSNGNAQAGADSIHGVNGCAPREPRALPANMAGTNGHHPKPSRGPKRHRQPPRCIAWKESPELPLSVVPEAYQRFLTHQSVNDHATCAAELYSVTNANAVVAKSHHQGTDSIDSLIPWRLQEAFAMLR